MKRKVYADHAATTPLDPEALDAMLPFLKGEYGNPSALYSMARIPRKAVRHAREIIASCIGAEPEEIYFTSGSTESDNWAIRGVAEAWKNGDKEILVGITEHHAILRVCESLEKTGIFVKRLPVDVTGVVKPETLEDSITNNTGLVSIMMANNELGTLSDVRALALIAHRNGALFHTDAVQAVGHVPIQVKKMGVDLLSASAHKFNGPKGVGFLYVKGGIYIEPLLYGGAQENHARAGTENVAGVVGMGVALYNHCKRLKNEICYLTQLEDFMKQKLESSGLDFCINIGPNHIPGLLSISFKDADGEMLLHRLDLQGIEVATGSACNSQETEVSYVLRAAQIPEDYINGTLRISLGVENTIEEIEYIVQKLESILKR